MSRKSRQLVLGRMAAGLACLLIGVGISGRVRGQIPPYAEEWMTPCIPEDVEVDPAGRVWVSGVDDSIRVYTATGGQLLFAFGGTGTGDGEFLTPYGIAFDVAGNAYICDYAGARIEKFTANGIFLLSWPIPSVRADHVDIDAAGDVYVTGYDDLSVHKYTPAGTPLLDWTSASGSRTAGILAAGDIIRVVQWDVPQVEQYDPDGTFLGSFETQAYLGDDIELDAQDQLWVADYGNSVVRAFATDGTPIGVLGAPGGGPGEFSGTIGLAAGPDGSLYVADEGNQRIQRFGPPVSSVSPVGAGSSPAIEIHSLAPNPCRTTFALEYELSQGQNVRLAVTDVTGRTVANIDQGTMTAGTHRFEWAPRNGSRQLAAGVYQVRIIGNRQVATTRLVVTR